MLEGMGMDGLREAFGRMLGMGEEKYEAIAQLTPDQTKEWDECQRMLKEAEMIMAEAKARKDLLWARIRRSMGPTNDRDSLKIENGILYGTIDTPKEAHKPLPPPPILED